jgi:uncharacterized membrane protein
VTLFALLLSGVGIWISIYFTGVAYHWFSPHVKWVPRVCQLKESACQLVLETPRAKLFGIPNSVYGIGIYLYLLFFFLGAPLSWHLGVFLAAVAVLRSIYLAYSLLFVTKIPCPLCFTSHGINLFLLICLWLGH